MNQLHWYNEKLDSFLKDELSAQDHQIFQEILETDPLLKNEVFLQKDIYDALCKTRKDELKARLNKINVEPTASFYALPRTALFGTLAIASIMTGLLVYFDINKKQDFLPKTQNKNIIVLPPAITPSPSITDNDPASHKEDEEATPITPILIVKQNQDELDLVELQNQLDEKIQNEVRKVSEPEIVDLRLKKFPKKETIIKDISPILVVSIPETHNLDKTPQAKIKNLRSIKNNSKKKQSGTLAYETRNNDSDLGIFDGKNEASLESIAEKNKLGYQYYNGKLFLIDPSVKGKEIHLNYNGKTRHFLLYDQEFFEFFDNRYEKSDLQSVKEPDLIDLLNKEIKK